MADTRIVTLLFCDLVASTELTARIGDDAYDNVRREFFAAMREVIAAHNGDEVKTVGDQFMVAFTESGADAVACAVAMQRAVARLNERDPLLRLAIRVGLSAGEASAEEGDWFGTPVVEASRLEGAARPGQILAADHLLWLVGSRGGHVFTSVGALALRGLEKPVPASEVAWEPDPGLPSIPLPSGLDRSGLPFVGRDAELQALERGWDQTRSGGHPLALISGERGMGKTRLAAEFAARVHSDETIVLYGRNDKGFEIPYQPFAETLRWYTISAKPGILREHIGGLGPELTRIAPALRNRLPELPEPRPADADTERLRLFDAVAGLFSSTSEQAPILLVLDELHQASAQTLGMLRHLLDAPGAPRIFVVGLAEASEPGSAWEAAGTALRERPGSSVIELEGLSAENILSSLERVAGADLGPGGERLAARVREETEGSPRSISELVARLDEAGAIAPDAVAAAADGELPTAAAEVLEAASPYMGLRAFEPENAPLFFGREEATVNLLTRLASGRLLTVVGASGSGKSSLVRAGLVPEIRRGGLPGSGEWPTVIFTPGAEPLATLAAKLAAAGGVTAAAVLRDLEADTRTLDLSVRQALDEAPEAARMLLVVDQFEELFTLCRDPEERGRFVEALLHAVTVPGGRTTVIIAMRADFYGESAAFAGFAEALEASHALLGPMGEDDLRAAIERPAELAGLRLEAGLAGLMLADVGSEPGGLPLLSHALLETWKRRDGRTLTIDGYREAGGVRGAIARTADAEYGALDPAQQAIASGLFVRLTELGEGTEDTRRRVAFREVVPEGAEGERVQAVIQTLTDARLLTTAEETVEVAHEALIREWPRLRSWLDEDREGLRLLRHLTESAQAWEGLDRDQGELYRGSRLAGAIDWVERASPDLNPLEREFLEASRDLHERELREAAARLRRLRMLLGGVAAALVVAVVAAGLAFVQQRRADDARAEADQRALEFAFRDALAQDRSLGLLLAVEGRRGEDSVTTRGNLQAALVDDPGLLGYLFSRGGKLALSPDGKLAAISSFDGVLEFWDLNGRERMGEPIEVPGNKNAFGVAFSPDGSLLAVSGGYDITVFYDVATRSPVGSMADGGSGLAFSPDGRMLALGREDGSVGLRTVDSGELLADLPALVGSLGLRAAIVGASLDFSPSGAILVTGGEGGVAVWDVATLELVETLPAPGDGGFSFSPDGTRFATSGYSPATNSVVVLWNSTTFERIGEPIQLGNDVESVTFTADGSLLATFGDLGTIRFWNATTGDPAGEALETGLGSLYGLAFTPDGLSLVAKSGGEALGIWDTGGQQLLATRLAADAGSVPVRSPDGTLAYARASDGRSWTLLATNSWEPVGESHPLPDGVATFTAPYPFSPDGAVIIHSSQPCGESGPCGQGSVVLSDAASGRPVGEPFPANFCALRYGMAAAAALSSDGETLAVGGCGADVTLWDVADRQPIGDPLRDLEILDGGVYILRFFERSGRSLLAGYGLLPLQVAVWDVSVHPPVVVGVQEESSLRGIWVHPKGYLVLGKANGTLELLDSLDFDEETEAFRPVQSFVGGTELIGVVSFSADGSLMLTSNRGGGDTRLWDVDSGEQVGDSFGSDTNASLAPDGKSFVSVPVGGGPLTEWNLDPDFWEEQACKAAGRNLTRAEWTKFLPPGAPYRATCERWPLAAEHDGDGSE